jgi:hypothetical protein
MAKPFITKYESSKNYALIKLDWNKQLLLPYQQGLQVMAAIEHAEILEGLGYGNNTTIKPLPTDTYSLNTISETELIDIKTAQLLGVNYTEYLNAKSTAKETTGNS